MRRLIGIGCGAIGVAAAVALLIPAPACTNHQCDPRTILGADAATDPFTPTIGEAVPGDPNAWESNSTFGKWLDFPGQSTIFFYLPQQFQGREILQYSATLAVVETPVGGNGNNNIFVNGSGNGVEFSLFPQHNGDPTDPTDAGDSLVISAYNDTCSEYWTRVVITFAPAPASSAMPDGGALPEASAVDDAGSDANDAAASDVDDASDGALE